MSTSHISIIMATHNAAEDLPGALASISAVAAGSPLYIWDGGSKDATVAILQKEQKRIRHWESAPDEGIYDAFTRALTWVETPFVFFLGADDRLRPEWAEAAETVSDPHTLYYGDVWRIGSQQKYRGPFRGADLAKTNICQQSIFYPTPLFKRHRFQPEYLLQADWEMNMWCWKQADIAFQYLPYCVCNFNDQTGRSSQNYDRAFNRDYPGLVRKYFSYAAWIRFGVPAGLAHHTRSLRGLS